MPRSLKNKFCSPLKPLKYKSHEGRGCHSSQYLALCLALTKQTLKISFVSEWLTLPSWPSYMAFNTPLQVQGVCAYFLIHKHLCLQTTYKYVAERWLPPGGHACATCHRAACRKTVRHPPPKSILSCPCAPSTVYHQHWQGSKGLPNSRL